MSQIVPVAHSGNFDTGLVAVPGTATYVLLSTIVLQPTLGGNIKSFGDAAFEIIVGANAITGFKLTGATNVGGDQLPLLVDTDFNTVSALCLWATANFSTTAAASNAVAKLSALLGMAEIGLWAKASSATTVRAIGSVR